MANAISRSLNYLGGLFDGEFAKSVEDTAKGGFKRVLHTNNAANPLAPSVSEHIFGLAETASRYYHGEGKYGLKEAFADSFLNNADKITYKDSLIKSGVKDFSKYTDKELAQQVYDLSSENVRYGKIAASGFGAAATFSAASGLLHDSNGNTDIAGIPFI